MSWILAWLELGGRRLFFGVLAGAGPTPEAARALVAAKKSGGWAGDIVTASAAGTGCGGTQASQIAVLSRYVSRVVERSGLLDFVQVTVR